MENQTSTSVYPSNSFASPFCYIHTYVFTLVSNYLPIQLARQLRLSTDLPMCTPTRHLPVYLPNYRPVDQSTQLLVSLSTLKGKIHHRTGHEEPEGDKTYNSTRSLTSAQDLGGWSRPHSSRFTPRNDPVPIVQETGWAPGPIWTGGQNLFPNWIRSPDRSVRSQSLYRLRYTYIQNSLHNVSCHQGAQMFVYSRSLTGSFVMCRLYLTAGTPVPFTRNRPHKKSLYKSAPPSIYLTSTSLSTLFLTVHLHSFFDCGRLYNYRTIKSFSQAMTCQVVARMSRSGDSALQTFEISTRNQHRATSSPLQRQCWQYPVRYCCLEMQLCNIFTVERSFFLNRQTDDV